MQGCCSAMMCWLCVAVLFNRSRRKSILASSVLDINVNGGAQSIEKDLFDVCLFALD